MSEKLSAEAMRYALCHVATVKVHAEHTDCNHETRRTRFEYGTDENGYVTRTPVSSYRTGIWEQNRKCDLADYQNDRLRCKHGTYTGTWDGPDHMCGMCESEEYQEGNLWLYAIAIGHAREWQRNQQRAKNRKRVDALKALRADCTDATEREALLDQMLDLIGKC